MTTARRNKRALLKPLAVLGLLAAVLAVLVLSSSPAESAFPGWNGKIAFTSDRDGNGEIYVMDADGSGQTNLTHNAANDGGPAWSPDGTRIAFWSDRDGNYEVYVMNADGSGLIRLTYDPASDYGPAWSPDGTKIAFFSSRDGNFEVYVMNADGSGLTRLTDDPASDHGPDWSPDGTKIAFGTNRDGNYEVYVMNADGTGQTNLTNTLESEGGPDWSPDGKRIAFGRAVGVGVWTSDVYVSDLYVMNAHGGGLKNLTNNPAGGKINIAWSPDGTKIAFTTDRDGNMEVYVMNADGSGQTNLTNNLAFDSGPDWQPLAGPAILLDNLVDDVIGLNLQAGIENSLDGKVDAALKAVVDLNQNNDVAACNALQAFINAVEAQRGNKIPDLDADTLIAATQEIIPLLSCP